MAEKAGIQSVLSGYDYKKKFSKDSHELRDLLESTLLDCSVRSDVVEHVTGHKPRDSYEKQAKLFPATLRSEYMKASKRINIFSNISHYMKGNEETEALRNQLNDLKIEMDALRGENLDTQVMQRAGRILIDKLLHDEHSKKLIKKHLGLLEL